MSCAGHLGISHVLTTEINLEAESKRVAWIVRPQADNNAGKKGYVGTLLKLMPVLTVLGLYGLAVWVLMMYFRRILAELGSWGYLGVFLAELLNSASVLFPTPASAFTMSMATVLNPVLVGLVGGIASSLGELTGYYLGVKGRRVLQQGRLYQRFRSLAGRWTGVGIFAFAMLPLPFDFAGVWAGTVRYPVLRFFSFLVMGKILKVMAFALAAYYGLTWLFGPLAPQPTP
jgi:membrane protein YqaA with SNARE-associated domain